MKRVALPWKPYWYFHLHSYSRLSPFWCLVKGSHRERNSIGLSHAAARAYSRDQGFLLVFLLPLLLLLALILAGTLKVAWSSQNAISLQSRLDVCAVKLTVARKTTLSHLVKSNRALSATVVGIYIARGVRVLGHVGAILGGASEMALLKVNRGLAALQDAELALAGALEMRNLSCKHSRFSREAAACIPSPALLQALEREKTFFPDVKGALRHRKRENTLARFRCFALGKTLKATIELRGDSELKSNGLHDAYVE